MFRMRRLAIMIKMLLLLSAAVTAINRVSFAADLSEIEVKQSIEQGKKFLISTQNQDGSWSNDKRIGVTSLCVLALINCGMSPQESAAKRGLQYLRARSVDDVAGGHETYQTSLLIMALVAARQKSDNPQIEKFAERLEKGQQTGGAAAGGWDYRLEKNNLGLRPDQSNSQFAVLGLREAVEAGYSVDRDTWERVREFWERNQKVDGGWGYGTSSSSGSMTVAGVASLSIVQQMLHSDAGVAADGTPPCCEETPPNKSLQSGINWLAKSFSVNTNPGPSHAWIMYYIYGIERAGRLSGQRFFGDHDWYREGAAKLVREQIAIDGRWIGIGYDELEPVISTSFALLFLSKGLAPVLVNKLRYGTRPKDRPDEVANNLWNRHPRDVRNLAELISSMPRWPSLLTTQEIDIARAAKAGVNSLRQGAVLFITGPGPLPFNEEETKLLKDYLEEGGFIFACPTCKSELFEISFRELMIKLMPPGEGQLKLLPPDHPVYRSEHPLQPESVKLYGVDFGCQTSVIYSPEDLACLWDYWAKIDPPKRNVQLKAKITRATRIGVNVMAYATGREPPDKTQVRDLVANKNELDRVERGLLQIAQIKHSGTWNAAPRALRNLLTALNQSVGLAASTSIRDLEFSDKNLFRYPVVYMHGRTRFTVSREERQQLAEYLQVGGVLVADACCGAKPFDRSFREFIAQLYPDRKLERIPITHEIFSATIGQDIKLLKRRTIEGGDNATSTTFTERTAEPILEGIELDGRYAVIYSKYDISCALERKTAGNCEGYLPEDAVKLGTNIVLYTMLQDVRLSPEKGAGGN